VDPFRELFPDLQRYTWRKKTPFKQARLDFFLFPDSMLTNLVNCKIEPSYRSDHSMVILELEFKPFVRGKGLWKFNNCTSTYGVLLCVKFNKNNTLDGFEGLQGL
jgi:hypothetical protein